MTDTAGHPELNTIPMSTSDTLCNSDLPFEVWLEVSDWLLEPPFDVLRRHTHHTPCEEYAEDGTDHHIWYEHDDLCLACFNIKLIRYSSVARKVAFLFQHIAESRLICLHQHLEEARCAERL